MRRAGVRRRRAARGGRPARARPPGHGTRQRRCAHRATSRDWGDPAGTLASNGYRGFLPQLADRTVLLTTGAASLGHERSLRRRSAGGPDRVARGFRTPGAIGAGRLRRGRAAGVGLWPRAAAAAREFLRVAGETRPGWSLGTGLNRWSTVHIDDLPALYAPSSRRRLAASAPAPPQRPAWWTLRNRSPGATAVASFTRRSRRPAL